MPLIIVSLKPVFLCADFYVTFSYVMTLLFSSTSFPESISSLLGHFCCFTTSYRVLLSCCLFLGALLLSGHMMYILSALWYLLSDMCTLPLSLAFCWLNFSFSSHLDSILAWASCFSFLVFTPKSWIGERFLFQACVQSVGKGQGGSSGRHRLQCPLHLCPRSGSALGQYETRHLSFSCGARASPCLQPAKREFQEHASYTGSLHLDSWAVGLQKAGRGWSCYTLTQPSPPCHSLLSHWAQGGLVRRPQDWTLLLQSGFYWFLPLGCHLIRIICSPSSTLILQGLESSFHAPRLPALLIKSFSSYVVVCSSGISKIH